MLSTLLFSFSFLQVALLTAIPISPSSSSSIVGSLLTGGQCTRAYTVREGDICDSISEAQNSPTFQLALANLGVIDRWCTNLQIGQQICLGLAELDCQEVYVVRPSDTCHAIAFRLALDANLLVANNPQINSDCSNIYVGEVLCASRDLFLLQTSPLLAPNPVLAPGVVHAPVDTIPPSVVVTHTQSQQVTNQDCDD